MLTLRQWLQKNKTNKQQRIVLLRLSNVTVQPVNSRVSVSDEGIVMLMHDCWEVFHFGQEGPRRAIVTLFRNLERRQTLAGQAGQRRKHGGADLWLRRGDTMKKSLFF